MVCGVGDATCTGRRQGAVRGRHTCAGATANARPPISNSTVMSTKAHTSPTARVQQLQCGSSNRSAADPHPPAENGKGGGTTVGGSWLEPAAERYMRSFSTAMPVVGSPAAGMC